MSVNNPDATLDLLYQNLEQSILEINHSDREENHLTVENLENEHFLESGTDMFLPPSNVMRETENSQASQHLSSPFRLDVASSGDTKSLQGASDTTPISISNEFKDNHKVSDNNYNLELLSGRTYIEYSTTRSNLRSPNSIKLKEMIYDEEELSKDKTSSDPQLSATLNMESATADLPFDSMTPFKVKHDESVSEKDAETGSTELSLVSGVDSSLQVMQPPPEVSLTNTVKINHFISGNDGENPPSRLSSGSSYDNERTELSTTIQSDHFRLLEDSVAQEDKQQSLSDISSSSINELVRPLVDGKSERLSPYRFPKDEKMESVVTSIGDYKSAKFSQTQSNLASSVSSSSADDEIYFEGLKLLDTINGVGSTQDLDVTSSCTDDEKNLNTGDNLKTHDITRNKEDSDDGERTTSNTSYPSSKHAFPSGSNLTATNNEMKPLDSLPLAENADDAAGKSYLATKDIPGYETNSNHSQIMSESFLDKEVSTIKHSMAEASLTEMVESRSMIISNNSESIGTKITMRSFSVPILTQALDEKDLRKLISLELSVKEPLLDHKNVKGNDINEFVTENESISSIVHSMNNEHPKTSEPPVEQNISSISSSEDLDEIEMAIENLRIEGAKESGETKKDSDAGIELQFPNQSNFDSRAASGVSIPFSDTPPTLPNLPKLDPLFDDALFKDDTETSTDSIKKNIEKNPTNYLAIWHLQEVTKPVSNTDNVTIKKEPKKSKLESKQFSCTFKPRIVHSTKIHYSEKRQNPETDSISFSKDFEGAIEELMSEPQSPRIGSLGSGPHQIWRNNVVELSDINKRKAFSIGRIFGPEVESSGIVKSSSNRACVEKAASVKSYEADVETTNEFIGSDFSEIDATPVTNTSEKVVSTPVKGVPFNTNHISSPFKVVPKRLQGESSKANERLLFSDISRPTSKAGKLEEDVRNFSVLDMPNTVQEKSVVEEPKEKLLDYGIVYLFLDRIKVELDGIKHHNATFSLEIDNGLNVTNTPWSTLDSSKYLVLNRELEIPITNHHQQMNITLKCKFDRPETQLVEAIHKVKVGKAFGGLGKNRYRYEKKFVQKKIAKDSWDYLFALDGSFGRAIITLNEAFLDAIAFKVDEKFSENMMNKWARIFGQSDGDKPLRELPHRLPYSIGKLKYQCSFIKRTSNLETFPSTFEAAKKVVQEYQYQQGIYKEGRLLQDGGDLDGVLQNRLFKLKGTRLIGYNESSMKAKIKINLLNVDVVVDSEQISKKGRNFTDLFLFGESCFQLVFKDGESITFISQNCLEETKEWFAILKKIVELNVTHQPWVKQLSQNVRTEKTDDVRIRMKNYYIDI
ncbi:Bud4p KNAG_0D01430 [Huiozyma naganishii CBS 8797]|uniref:PH domain-containing protein n=1 Tax=Huiozyma naganishii (strain ATCC MYA-139 / BCRC 22969 / CBS 8797 / KCTC 17520 / NBRC 10181 / NCYC 3082 / Yp74L-3) TaxID=1071383 RepID=J7R4X3_HUIN7|nr:hypothetical protein KNAG_0D01430 [Kazachstania naganishii CBS 8797]CCK69895.1 hypothetical protein KNAG_0D01430 [Kazachstania naganishii CBS 8797]